MDRIAETAKVSKRTVYNHFESKGVLFTTISEELCDTFSHQSDHPYEADKSVRSQLEAIARQQMKMLCTEKFLRMFKMFVSETLTSPELTQPIMENLEKENIGIVKWIKAASKDGKLRISEPLVAGKQFMALLEAFTSWPYLFGMDRVEEEKDQIGVAKSAVDMFLDHYEVR